MASQKFYWLKLKRDFFKRHDVRIIESMPNGKDYILFYLKMLLESIDHNGELRFSDAIPYNEQMLSIITNTNIDIVRAAMQLFVDLKLIEIKSDETIYMEEVTRMIGSETRWAEYKRLDKAKKAELPPKLENFQCDSKIFPTEKEKDKEKDIEKEDKGGDTPPPPPRHNYKSIQFLYNDICVSLPRCMALSDARKKAIAARINSGYKEEDFRQLFVKAEASSFLRGSNPRNWVATFDWLIKDSNMAKVLDGNYDDKSPQLKKSGKEAQLEKYLRWD